MMTARRLLILSSSTGSGHDMRAAALVQWVERLRGSEVGTRRYQALEESSTLDRFGVNLYNWIQRHCPWAHHIYFNFLEIAGLHRKVSHLRGKERLLAVIHDFRPDVVVSTHAHLNHAYFEAIRRAMQPDPPRCLTYCGELHGSYGFSRHWVNPQADGFIAAVPSCAEAALARGMPKERVHLGGFLLKPAFYLKPDQATETPPHPSLFESLPADRPEGPLVLLGTGANGANNHLAILRSLDELKKPVTVIALCGRNAAVQAQLKNLACPPHTVVPLGYRDDMHDLLRAVDLAFIRPGTGSTCECIQSGCPILFNGIGGVMPQERITVHYMRTLGLEPQVVRRPAQFASALEKLLFQKEAKSMLGGQKEAFRHVNRGLTPAGIVAEVLA
ncbi:MAG: UDP-N-acetylglucosamine--LPS N-acetylglucosamine transferase [Verrucomicrobia bacterium]|jgi:processive 1,2-diacylglycerol beta-glucosyltransferase|nr:UDP-N-acetylglucosamine--LPS N-acetylglucosamine transferase [Verrucomicrobiota bacterium]